MSIAPPRVRTRVALWLVCFRFRCYLPSGVFLGHQRHLPLAGIPDPRISQEASIALQSWLTSSRTQVLCHDSSPLKYMNQLGNGDGTLGSSPLHGTTRAGNVANRYR
jgi:hypothetical protein